MIERVTAKNVLKFIKCIDGATCTGIRIQTAYACYGLNSQTCAFYLIDDAAALCVCGETALHCGTRLIDADELAAFMHMLGIKTFMSETMLFPQWKAVPLLLMVCNKAIEMPQDVQIDEAPSLWQASRTMFYVDKDVWYSDACTRVNKGYGEVHAIQKDGEYAALAYARCISKNGIYLTCVQTLESYRKQGLARAIVASFCKGDRVFLICRPGLRHFYEKCGFTLAAPICEYEPNE